MLPTLPDFPPGAGFLDETASPASMVNAAVVRELATDMAFAIFKLLAGDVRPELAGSMLVLRQPNDATFDAALIPQPLSACMGYCRRYAHRGQDAHHA
jgi:hypothetical protein